MQFYKTITLSPDEETAYRIFMMRNENYTLRLANFMAVIYSFILLIIDYWRAEHFPYVLTHRSLMILFSTGLVIYITRKPVFSLTAFNIICAVTCVYWVLLSISLDYHAGMPAFFLPNFFCLMFYVFNAGLGHPLKLKTILNVIFIVLFLIYIFVASPHPSSHILQVWNITFNGAVSLFIGFLIERYKQLNFIQRMQLIDSRNKVEEMNTVKSKLISILSHDLNAPLNKLKALLQLNDKGAITEAESKLYFDRVGKSVDGISLMLSNLVRWSKTQLQGFKTETEDIHAQKFVEEIIYSLESIASEKDIKFLNLVHEDVYFLADREMARLIIRNILSNSIKFSYPHTTVSISSKTDSSFCSIVIKDNGTGMSQDDLKNLFSLRTISKKGTQDESGTGLGLMLTKEFIEILGGTIHVESAEGKGSVFSVNFPRK